MWGYAVRNISEDRERNFRLRENLKSHILVFNASVVACTVQVKNTFDLDLKISDKKLETSDWFDSLKW